MDADLMDTDPEAGEEEEVVPPAQPLVTPYAAFAYLPHQAHAIEWMLRREERHAPLARGGILADDMGLGKTWMAIGLLLNAAARTGWQQPQATLIVAPPALIPQWCAALHDACIPHGVLEPGVAARTRHTAEAAALRGYAWRPQPVAAAADRRASALHVCLVTYDRAARPAARDAILASGPFTRLVLDEGHVLRNGPGTRRFDALCRVEAGARWLLTGTPVQNDVADFTNLLAFLRAEEPGVEAVAAAMTAAGTRVAQLAAAAQVLMLRRQMSVLRAALPAAPRAAPRHVVTPVTLPPGSDEAAWFSKLEGRFRAAVAAHGSVWVVLELYLRVQQFLAHPQIFFDAMRRKYAAYAGALGEGAWAGSASRLAAFRAVLDGAPPAPTIVFTRFRAEMDFAVAALRERGYGVWCIRGGMRRPAFAAAVEQSRAAVAGGHAAVALVVQIQAGSAGLNLQHCHRVVFLTQHYNPAVMDQAVARAHRMGQRHAVTVHHLLLADGSDRNMDRLVLSLHAAKRAAAAQISAALTTDCALPDIEEALELLLRAGERGRRRQEEEGGDVEADAEADDPVGGMEEEEAVAAVAAVAAWDHPPPPLVAM